MCVLSNIGARNPVNNNDWTKQHFSCHVNLWIYWWGLHASKGFFRCSPPTFLIHKWWATHLNGIYSILDEPGMSRSESSCVRRRLSKLPFDQNFQMESIRLDGDFRYRAAMPPTKLATMRTIGQMRSWQYEFWKMSAVHLPENPFV